MAWRNYRPKGTNNKYRAKKTEVDGLIFDSAREARRYRELTLLERAGEICDLQRQVKYILIPTQREPDTIGKRGGVHKGKLIEKEVAYYADFVYINKKTGETVVEDAKGMKTQEYSIKRKLMLWVHGVRIQEI